MNARLPDLLPMLRTLVETPSVSSTDPRHDQSNAGVVDELATWLEDLGFAVESLPLPEQPGKRNLVATLGRGPGGLVFAGHTDTVPCDPDLWNSDPFSLVEREDRVYGLGTCDMKGFFPLALEAIRDVAAKDLAEPVILLATADEECSMDGARALVEQGTPKARHVVVGEPTGLVPQRMHKGMMVNAIRIRGRSGHSSDPSLGANALDAMHPVLGELIALRSELAERWTNAAFEVAVPTMNLGCMHAGDNPNRICGHAELQIDLRLLPGMDADAIQEELVRRLAPIGPRHGVELAVVPMHPPNPPFETPASSDLIRAVERLTGHEAGAVSFGTEAPYFQQLGMDAVVLGPGHIDQAHQPDEFLDLSQIRPTIDVLRSLVEEFCLPGRA